ncbi:MAG: type II toxin-antitoxin system HicB family antitoxin [Betaproteobacteria bacterium]
MMTNVMEYKGYKASMEFDVEDKIIVGRVLDIDDIIAFHGDSVGQFEKNFHKSIDSYVKDCEKLNQRPDKPVSGRLMLRVEPKVHAAAIKKAARSGVSLNKWAESILKEATSQA